MFPPKYFVLTILLVIFSKKNLNASDYNLDLLSIPQPGRRKNVKTFRWDHRLQRRNLFMAFNRAARWVVTLGKQYHVGEEPIVILFVGMCEHYILQSMDQPSKVANPARGQLNREN